MQIAPAKCDVCGGTGWVPEEPGGFRVRACECQDDLKRTTRTNNASIPERYVPHCTLENFHERGNPTLMSAKRRVARFVDEWPIADRGLLLMGPCGTGKTHLAVGCLLEIIAQGKPGRLLFSNFQDLIQQILMSFDSNQAPSRLEILGPVIAADLLVLDELGSQKPTQFVQDMLYYIINSRYNSHKATIFTTNYVDEPREAREESLETRIGARLRSRLYEMADRVVIDSEDYRKNVAGKWV